MVDKKVLPDKFLIISIILAPALSSVLVNSNLDPSVQSGLGIGLIIGIISISIVVIILDFLKANNVSKYEFELQKIEKSNEIEKIKIKSQSQEQVELSRIKQQGSSGNLIGMVMSTLIENPELGKGLKQQTENLKKLTQNIKEDSESN